MASPAPSLKESPSLAESSSSGVTNLDPGELTAAVRSLNGIQLPAIPRWTPLAEGAKTFFALSVHGVDEQTIVPEDLTLDDLELCLQVMEQSNETVNAENLLLENYLASVDPTLIENMDKILEATTAAILKAERNVQLGVMAAVNTLSQATKSGQESQTSSPRSTGQSGSKMGAFGLADKGPKVQPSQKIEIIQREMDIIKSSFDDFRNLSHRKIFAMECRQEECQITLRELKSGRKNFESSLKKEWVDPTIMKIPGEKIISFFELKNRSDAILIKSIYTRSKNLKIQLEAVAIKLKELGEDLHYVDYEQLQIQNDCVKQRLSNKLNHSTDLKQTNSEYLSYLNATRGRIFETNRDIKATETQIMKKDCKIMRLLHDETRIIDEIQSRQRKIDEIAGLLKKYSAPDVMDYIRHITEFDTLKKTLQVTERKNKLYEDRMLRKTLLEKKKKDL